MVTQKRKDGRDHVSFRRGSQADLTSEHGRRLLGPQEGTRPPMKAQVRLVPFADPCGAAKDSLALTSVLAPHA